MFTNSWYFVDLYNIRQLEDVITLQFVIFTKSWYFVLHVLSMCLSMTEVDSLYMYVYVSI